MPELRLHNTLKFAIFLIFVLSFTCSQAQIARLTGKITDHISGKPIQYANIALRLEQDSFLLHGGITDEKGFCELSDIPYGIYMVKVSFIGYDSDTIKSLVIDRPRVDIGGIALKISTQNLTEVEVKGGSTGISYQVDRKIIEAKDFPGADKAMDLLENVPSLQVDIDGKLTYRGDGNFIVYVNGRPEQNGEEKLRQIPVEKIQHIEVITNPTAKYDAEGTAGIIQVILKRNRLEGYAINTSIKASSLGSKEWLFSVDQKSEKGGWYIEGQWDNYVGKKQESTTKQLITNNETLYQTLSTLNTKDYGNNSFVKFGFNYDLTDKDYLDFMLSGDPIQRSNIYLDKGTYTESERIDGAAASAEAYDYDSRFDMYYRYLSTVTTYEHAFAKDRSHLLSVYVDYSTYLHPLKEKKLDVKAYEDYTEKLGYQAKEYNEMILKTNIAYKNELSEKSKFEMGIDVDLDHIPKLTTESGTFRADNTIESFPNEKSDQKVNFEQDVYAGFITFESSFGKLDYKLGLRSEYTDRQSNFSYKNEELQQVVVPAEKGFVDFFPSAHFVFNFSEENQLSLSYSRRINRPDYWELVPLKRYETPYIYYTGNGDLLPSYVDAVELGYIRSWDENFISAEVFLRNTDNLIQSYYTTNDSSTITWTKENVGSSLSTGIELMSGFEIAGWWKMNLSASLYSYRLKVKIDDYEEEKWQGDIRFNNTFSISRSLTVRYQMVYQSPYIGAQTKRDDFMHANLAIRKSFFNRKWEAELAWANIFNSIKYNTITEANNLYVESHFEREPYVSVKLSYRFNNQN